MTPLRPFQCEGVREIYQFRGRCLLADEQGCGKTIQCLEWIRRLPKRRPVIIVCPASVKYVWQSEAALHFNMRTEVLEGRANGRKTLPGDIVILNYDILPSWLKVLRRSKPQIVIFDEAHYCQSLTSKRTRAVHKLVKGVPSVIGTSGTPMTNRPIELWPVLKAINPTIFPSRPEFAWRYCKPRFTPWGWRYDGAANTKELNGILVRRVMIRRLKKDVLKELPPLEQRVVPFRLKDYTEYNEAQKDFLSWLRKISPSKAVRAKKSAALTKVGYLIRLAARLKLEWTAQWIKDFLDANPGQKLVGLTMHRFVIEYLRERFRGRVLFIDGRVKGRKRHEVVRAFQSNRRCTLLLGNWRAAGVGITLTAASNVAALDLPWTPGDLMQGRDRIHRIGQKHQCTMWFLMALQTIEEKQVRLLRKKMKVIDAVLNGREHTTPDFDILGELLREMMTTTL